MTSLPSTPKTTEASAWPQLLARYRQPSTGRGIVEIAITVLPLVALWALAWLTLDIGYWLALPIAIAAGAFLVRLFAISTIAVTAPSSATGWPMTGSAAGSAC